MLLLTTDPLSYIFSFIHDPASPFSKILVPGATLVILTAVLCPTLSAVSSFLVASPPAASLSVFLLKHCEKRDRFVSAERFV